MTSVSVVIPCFNKWHLTHQLLFDLYKNCSLIEEVIVVDNGSTEKEVKDGLAWWATTHMLPIETITLKENVGFLRAANIGLKAAVEDVVVLISNDVRVTGDLSLMAKALPEVQNRNNGKILLGGVVYHESTGWNNFNGKVFSYVEGWLLVAENTSWQELGYFDERFAPNDFEDVDLSTTAISMGYSLSQFNPPIANHIGAQTIGYGTEREKLTTTNQKKFEEKWLQK